MTDNTIPPMPEPQDFKTIQGYILNVEHWGTAGWAEVQSLRAKLEEAERQRVFHVKSLCTIHDMRSRLRDIKFCDHDEDPVDAVASHVKATEAERDAARADSERLAEALGELVTRRENACRLTGGHPNGSDGRYIRARAALAAYREGK